MPEFKLIEKLLYKSEQNNIEAEFLIGNETLWASQNVVAEIFGTSSQNISKHFIKIIEDEELEEKEVSISSKKLFENQNEFINSELINSKKEEDLKNGIILMQSYQ